ncbi:hypothetical protein M758_UG075400 [Ceratodon purpureus]|nr:hypothetical protein M758_UG075400 [Ceratodon purpureus]
MINCFVLCFGLFPFEADVVVNCRSFVTLCFFNYANKVYFHQIQCLASHL